MKRLFITLCLILSLILALPMVAHAEPSVRVTLTGSQIWVGADDATTLRIDVLNTGAEAVTVTSYTVNGVTETVSTPVNPGAVHRFYVETTIDFVEASQKTLISSVEIEGYGTVYSNAEVFYLKTGTPVAFSVDPASSVISSGDTVDYTILFTNNSAFDYAGVTISMDGTEIESEFTCEAGQTRTFNYSKTYTDPAEHVFSYAFDYLETDGSSKTSGGSERAMVSIKRVQPTGTALDGAALMPGVLTAMVEKDSAFDLKLYLKNNSDTALTNVRVYDQNGTEYGGWSRIDKGLTAGMTVALSPVEETTYIFTAYCKDADGTVRKIAADPVLLAVGYMPDGTTTTDPESPGSSLSSGAAQIASATTNKKSYIILGIVIAAIVVTLLLIVLMAASRRNIVKKAPTKKRKSSGKRNIF